MLAQALHTSLGGGLDVPSPLAELASPAQLKLATSWGLAIRLGQRLSGGLAGPLERTGLVLDDTRLGLRCWTQTGAFMAKRWSVAMRRSPPPWARSRSGLPALEPVDPAFCIGFDVQSVGAIIHRHRIARCDDPQLLNTGALLRRHA